MKNQMNDKQPITDALVQTATASSNGSIDGDFRAIMPTRFSSISAPELFPILPHDYNSVSAPDTGYSIESNGIGIELE